MGEATKIPESFYLDLGDGRFASTAATRGPWDERTQHAGPPAALLAYAIEHREGARADMRVARIAYSISRPVPIAPVLVTTRVIRSGRGTEEVEATLAALDANGEPGRAVMRAEAVLIRVAPGATPAHRRSLKIIEPAALTSTVTPFLFDVGYHTAMETRDAEGSFAKPGPATIWFRMRCPLIAGQPIDPLSRVLIAADSGNGVSQVLDPLTHVFINAELTVHLLRYPVGEWVCIDAVTLIEPDGIGLADTALYDIEGSIGRGSQSLFVAMRP